MNNTSNRISAAFVVKGYIFIFYMHFIRVVRNL